jgi:hypothetical protein
MEKLQFNPMGTEKGVLRTFVQYACLQLKRKRGRKSTRGSDASKERKKEERGRS